MSLSFKNVSNPSCIDLFLTNNALFFQHTETTFTRLSDFHKLVNQEKFITEIIRSLTLSNFNVDLKNAFAREKRESCIKFDTVFTTELNRHAPLKKKILRANHSSYMSKTLRKAIMRRSYLEKKYFQKKNRSVS